MALWLPHRILYMSTDPLRPDKKTNVVKSVFSIDCMYVSYYLRVMNHMTAKSKDSSMLLDLSMKP